MASQQSATVREACLALLPSLLAAMPAPASPAPPACGPEVVVVESKPPRMVGHQVFEGTVRVRLVVSVHGEVVEAAIVSAEWTRIHRVTGGAEALHRLLLKTMQAWKYSAPTATCVREQQISFRLEE